MAFDPDAFLAEKAAFDPDAFLAKKEEKPIKQLTADEAVEKMKFWKPENREALLKEAERLGPTKADLLAAPGRLALSVAKLPAGVAKLAGYKGPSEFVNQADAALKEFSGPKEGFMGSRGPVSTAASLTGDVYGANALLKGIGAIVKPAVSAVPAAAPVAAAVSASPLAQSTLGGGALGAIESPTNAPLDVMKSTVAGLGFGAAGHGIVAGAGRVMSPQLERLNQIKEQGFDVPKFIKESSVGQFFGGVPQKVENFMTNIPFSGAISNVESGAKSIAEQGKNLKTQVDMQRKAAAQGLGQANTAAAVQKAELLKSKGTEMDQRLAEHVATLNANVDKKYADFSTNMVNRALSPIGAKLETNVRGTDAIKFAQDKVDEAYKAAIPKIGEVRIGDEQVAALKQIVSDNKRKLGGENSEYYNKFAADVDDIIAKVGESKLISGDEWHNIFKDVGGQAFKNKGFGVKGTQAEYGDALTKLKTAWMDTIEGTPGAELIKQANAAHSALQVPQTAAGYLKTYTEKGGEFDPKDFLRALKAEASRKKFSAGEARLQDEALTTFEQMAKDKANVKAQEAAFKQQLTGKKGELKSAMKAENVTAGSNLANQRAYLEMLANQEQKPAINKLVEDVGFKPKDAYAEKRIGYTAAGLGGGHYLGNMLGITPEQQMMGVGAVLSGSNLLNSKFMQDAIKKAAVAERPEIVKQIGQGLQDIAVPASFAGTKATLDQRASEKQKQKRQPLAVPMADGGPVQHFFNGGLISPLVSVVQPQASSDTTSGSLVPTAAEPVAVAEPGKPIAPAVQPVQAFSGEMPGAGGLTSLENPAPVALESGMVNDTPMMTATGNNQNVLTQNNIGAGSVMPTIRQYTPQRPQQTVVPRRPQHGGMPTYMQNNRAYEAQRQARAPYTVFPPANQLLPQGRVTPRRGIPVARMAEGGPVKKK